MREHLCHQHRPGHHTATCLTGDCGFCGRDLAHVASGECRACLRIVCEECDGGYQNDLGPICRACTPPEPINSAAADGQEMCRLCVFEFALTCGHLVTVAMTGWYPVDVSCCDRLGGTVLRGVYVAYASTIDYVDVLSERYESRPAGTPPGTTLFIGRRPRSDKPRPSPYPGIDGSTGRYPARVGATWSLDGSIATPQN